LLWSEAVTEAFPAYAEVMTRAMRSEMLRYRRFGRAHMLWFRTSGFIEILLSVTFPFVITVLPGEEQYEVLNNRIIIGISVGIALVGAIRGFYSWNDNWRLYKTQQLALTIVVQRWELKLLALSVDPKANASQAHAETQQALEDLVIALQHEQDVFFGAVRLPEELVPNSGRQATNPQAAGQ